MGPIDDLELEPSPEMPPDAPLPKPALGFWIAAGAMAVAAGVAAYLLLWRPRGPAGEPTPTRTATEQAVDEPAALGAAAPPMALPPLAESDELVRTVVRELSSHPTLVAWLATDGIVRGFVAGVDNVAEGRTPAAHARALAPAQGFQVRDRGGDLFVDPRSYERYDRAGALVAEIDAQGAARAYTILKPLLDEAYRELGYPDRRFDATLERAVAHLLETPVVDGPVELVPDGIAFAYADRSLEALSAAQKQLLRMGPRNMQIVQSKLREIAVALGIPEGRLPRPSARPAR